VLAEFDAAVAALEAAVPSELSTVPSAVARHVVIMLRCPFAGDPKPGLFVAVR
jgi:hypothetical protein